MESAGRVEKPGPRLLHVLLAGCLGAAVSYACLGLLPPVRHEAGPATLEAGLKAGGGRTVLQIPPLGTVSADTHAPPVVMELALAQVDAARLAERVADAAARGHLAADVEADLRELGPRVAAQFAVAAAFLGAIAVALLPRRRIAFVVAGAAGGLVLTGALVGGAAVSFDAAAFAQPRFTGALVRAPVVIDALQAREITIGGLQSRYETAAARLSDLLALIASPNRDPATDSVALLHVSDIHSNPLGVEIAKQLAARFDVDAVLDTGDLTNFGVTAEARIGRLIGRIGVPYYLVPGNHDSAANEAALDRVENLTVLDGDVAEVEGVRILGWGDPTDTNWNRLDPDEASRIRLEEGEDTAQEVALVAPDVLAVHDKRLAEASFGAVPLVLAGHYHRRIVEEEAGTTVMSVGSTGATGLKFFVEADRDYEAEVVYFREGRAVAVDYVTFGGLGGDFEIQRTTLEPEARSGAGDIASGEPCEPAGEDALPAAAGCMSTAAGDLDGDGRSDVVTVYALRRDDGFPRTWRLRVELATGEELTSPLHVGEGEGYPQAVGTTDADGDGDDDAFVNVLDHVYHGGTTSVLGLFRMGPRGLERVRDATGVPLDFPVGGVSNFGEGVECRDPDGDGVPQVRLLRIDGATGERPRWIERVYRWSGQRLRLVRTERGHLSRRGFTDPRVLRYYELHCGRLDPPYPF